MSWELRGRQRVYYRARRVNGRVVKDYCGTGLVAELEAEEDAQAREERRSRLEGEQSKREALEAADLALEAFVRQTKATVQQVLTETGYHQHKRGGMEKDTWVTISSLGRARPHRQKSSPQRRRSKLRRGR